MFTSCLQSAAHKTRYWDYSLQKSLSFFLSSSKIYVVKSVDELLFTGYPDTLLNMGKLMVSDPDLPLYDRFGWFYTVRSPTKLVMFRFFITNRFICGRPTTISRHSRARPIKSHRPRGRRFYDHPFVTLVIPFLCKFVSFLAVMVACSASINVKVQSKLITFVLLYAFTSSLCFSVSYTI